MTDNLLTIQWILLKHLIGNPISTNDAGSACQFLKWLAMYQQSTIHVYLEST
jgi:hypothetical protein